MREVTSSAVRAVGYSAKTRELYVKFTHGNVTYVYVNVPLYKVGAIFRSKSRGKALHRHVLHDDAHKFRRLEGGETETDQVARHTTTQKEA